jgi:hypothetical protein
MGPIYGDSASLPLKAPKPPVAHAGTKRGPAATHHGLEALGCAVGSVKPYCDTKGFRAFVKFELPTSTPKQASINA